MMAKREDYQVSLTNDIFTKYILLYKKSGIIQDSIIKRYSFFSTFRHLPYLFFEDPYFSIFYLYDSHEDDDGKEKVIIYNFMIDKIYKKYIKNSMELVELKDAILNLYFTQLKRSFIYSNLHLSGYEYDLNHDINEWLNRVKYEDVNYSFLYGAKIIQIDGDYSFT